MANEIEQFLETATAAEKALLDAVRTYAEHQSGDYKAKYALAAAIRSIRFKYFVGDTTIKKVAELMCLNYVMVLHILTTTERLPKSAYAALHKTAEKNGVVLHWTHVSDACVRVKDARKRKALLQLLTEQQVTVSELNQIIRGVNNRPFKPRPKAKEVPAAKETPAAQTPVPVNVPAPVADTQPSILNADPMTEEDDNGKENHHSLPLTRAVKALRQQLKTLLWKATHMSPAQEAILLDDIDMFLNILREMCETEIPKTQRLFKELDRKFQTSLRAECRKFDKCRKDNDKQRAMREYADSV